MKRFSTLSMLTVTAFALCVGLQAQAASTPIVSLAQIQPGNLFRGQATSGVYYMGADGFRYVFPTDKVYFSWYTDFSSVKWVSDADLAKVQLGGNITYKPGSRMVKITSDPKTYFVGAGGTLRWVTTEAMAVSLYGADWNKKIDDVADAFFRNYTMGVEFNEMGGQDMVVQATMAEATSINEDKNLKAPTEYPLTNSNVNGSTSRPVKFINNGTSNMSATADDGSWGTGTLKPGETFSRYFKRPGVYSWSDPNRPGVTGTVTIQ